MIVLKELSLRYGEKVIFDGCSGVINARDGIGLVGPNGAGKSTLLKLLAGVQEIDGGEVEKASYVTVGYLPQDGIECSGESLFKEVEKAFTTVLSLRAEIEEASERLKELSPEEEAYHDLLEIIGEKEMQLADLEPQKLRSRIEKVLLGLGFKTTDMERDTGEFSGGWQMRIALAKLLLREPSILLMDEPTNHLDLPSQRWLESYLKSYRGALMLVSHDRAFLDTVCGRIFELGRGKLTIYTGNYSHYLVEKEQREEALLQAYRTQQKQIEKTQQFIDRFRSKATKAKQVQSRIKALDKVDRIELEEDQETVGFRFPEPERSGDRVIKLEGLTKRYGDLTVFENLSFELSRGDKVAVVGVNGAGKSTLAKVLAGVEPYQAGTRELGHRVEIGYFAQHQARELDLDSTPLQVLEECDQMGGERSRLRTILGSFLFHGDDVFKKVSVLSGGEKNRLALAKLLTMRSNFLIFDEPTNHLDMASKDVLQRALGEFGGSFLIVSHDRSFLDPIVNKVLEISPNRVRFFPGTVSEYIAKVEEEEKAQVTSQLNKDRREPSHNKEQDNLNPKERRRLEAEKRKLLTPLKQRVDKLEGQIGELEEEIASFEAAMAEPDFYNDPEVAKEKAIEYSALKDRLVKTYEDWEAATTEYEAKK